MAAHRVLFLAFVYLTLKKADALTADVVFDVLSRRLDHVIHEIETVKSDVVEIKLDVNRIEERIENIETNVTDIIKLTNQKEDGISKSVMPDKLKRQSKALQKMLATEKAILRDKVDQFQNMFSEFQIDIKSQFSLMNFSVGNSIESIEETVTNYKTDSNTYLLEMNMELQTMMNETDNRVEEIGHEVNEISKDSLKKINEVGESIKAKAKSDMQSAKNEMSSKLTSGISKLTTKLKALERVHESRNDDIDARIRDLQSRISSEESYTSRLSKRIAAEEARKVAFSARLTKKRSYYGKNQRILFDDVIYSHGGGYDSSTGIFTAPRSGTYLFVYNIESTSKGKAHVVLKVRGFIKTRALVDVGPNNNGGNAGIEYLSQGDTAEIKTSTLEDKYYIWPYRTTFNGILID